MNLLSKFFLLLIIVSGSVSQTLNAANPKLQVSVITIGPGEMIWERFGHIALRFRSNDSRTDVCYDWGRFGFDQPGFVKRFLFGDMRYWMGGSASTDVLAFYINEVDRTVTERILNLSDAEVERLIGIIQAQDTDAGRFYSYDYYLDNCSTRVRDALNQATQGRLKSQLTHQSTPLSLRSETRRLTGVGMSNQILLIGMDLVMGRPVDSLMSRWESSFVPMRFNQYLAETDIAGSETVLNTTDTTTNFEPLSASRRSFWVQTALGAAIGLVIIGLRNWTAGLRLSLIGWSAISSLACIIILFLWFFTRHWASALNENLVVFSPVSAAFLISILFRWRSGWPRKLAVFQACVNAVAILACAWLAQDNLGVLMLAGLPNFAAAIALTRTRHIDSPLRSIDMSLNNPVPVQALLLLLIFVTGCAGGNRPVERRTFERPRIPVAPAVVLTPIDEALQLKAIAEIADALASSDPVLRAQSLEATARTNDPSALVRIERALIDENSLVRFAGAMAAGDLRLKAVRNSLRKIAFDLDPSVRIGVRYALHRIGDRSLSRDLESLSQDPSPVVRSNAILVLGLTGEPTAVRVLHPLLKDTNATVRLLVAEALWRLGDQRGLEALVTATVSRFIDDQIVATLALASRRDTRVKDYVIGKLVADKDGGQSPELQLVAARALGMLGDDAGFAIAIAGAQSNDARRTQLAAFALGDIGRTDGQQTLARLLESLDPTVRLAAATSLRQIANRNAN